MKDQTEFPKRLPRVAAIHDLSCFGRCALTVILPALSAMGAQVVPLPTALLSTHTGGFEGLYFRDLTEDMGKITDHFGALGVEFDAIYSGFLGSAAQIDSLVNFLGMFGEKREGRAFVLVDPVMGDDGALYSTYNEELVAGVRRLCAYADLITPNLTEACFLLGRDYPDTSGLDEAGVRALADSLLDGLLVLGAKAIVITGLEFGGRVACAGNSADGRFFVTHDKERSGYPGTGDLFASVLLGCLLRGSALSEATEFASEYLSRVIADSAKIPTALREGVALEAHLGELCRWAEAHTAND